MLKALGTRRALTAAATATATAVALLLTPLAGPAAAGTVTPAGTASPALSITSVTPARDGSTLDVSVRYRCAPGMLTELVGIYDRTSFAWVGGDVLYGQEESRVFDVPCTGRYEKAQLRLVAEAPLPRRVWVHAGLGVSDPSDWSMAVANADRRVRL